VCAACWAPAAGRCSRRIFLDAPAHAILRTMRTRHVLVMAVLCILACAESTPTDGGDACDPAGNGAGNGEANGETNGEVLEPADPPERLTVVTLNTHSFQEGPDSLEKLGWIGEGLAAMDADLVGLNEVMSGTFWAYDFGGAQYDGTRIIQEALEDASGRPWYAATFGFAHWDDGEEMSNAILSRTPILAAERRELTTTDFWPAPDGRRNVAFARTQIPGVGIVHFFVTHTWGWSSVDAIVQIDEVKAFIEEKRRGDEVLTLLVGDLNTPSTWENYARWIEGPPFAFVDTYAEANPGGFADPTMFGGEHRIDYVLVREGSALGADPGTYASSLVFTGEPFDGAVLPVVSDHKGVATVFQLP
jgi:endonuclease/exonuclease/phosphatase family metal-dependent hydrolase